MFKYPNKNKLISICYHTIILITTITTTIFIIIDGGHVVLADSSRSDVGASVAADIGSHALGSTIAEIDSFKAIRTLHTKLDVDADGEVDDHESKRFLESDKIGKIANDKHAGAYSTAHKLRYLHQDGRDRSISVNELWEAWTASEVHNWTVDETIEWLVNCVDLPEYSQLFEQNSINGTLLPRLAADSHYLSKLGITDPSIKSKISIKAMDVVLFGPPKSSNSSRVRDIFISIVVVVASSACFIFYSRSRASQLALRAMHENLESLQKAEDQMLELQQELNKALKAQEAVATEKRNLEHQLEMQRQYSASSISVNGNNGKQGQSEALKNLLQDTYNIESLYYDEKKLRLESKATEVKLRNQKLQKKKNSLLGYYRMAQENSLEEDINTIIEVKEAIMEITKQIKERTERWRSIEKLSGCTLIIN